MRIVHGILGFMIVAVLAADAPRSFATDKEKKAATFDATKLSRAAAMAVDFVRDVRPLFEARC